MNIVQTFWSCNNDDVVNCKAGWLAPEYNFMSWALSCLQLRTYYENVVLHCDTASARMLIDTFGLPYTNVVTSLDQLSDCHCQLWAVPKILSYSLQQKPFLHIDGDVYIWKAFDTDLLAGGLIAQNMECATMYYESKIKDLDAHFQYYPEVISAERSAGNKLYAYNAGILGGHDLNFFQEYTQEAFRFVEYNKQHLSKISPVDFNIFFEQYLFYCMARRQHKRVSVLFNGLIEDNGYKGFGDFAEVPHNKRYLHLIGAYKRDAGVCRNLAARLRKDHPGYYYKIISFFKSRKLPLHRDYYYLLHDTSAEHLLQRYNFLQAQTGENGLPDNYKSHSGAGIDNANAPPGCQPEWCKQPDGLTLSTGQKEDLSGFADALAQITKTRFGYIDKEQLYKRDIMYTGYFEELFQEGANVQNKMLLTDPRVEVLQSMFDWSMLLTGANGQFSNMIVNQVPAITHTIVVPECDAVGYSLYNIDELDRLMLEILQQPVTIGQLFHQLTNAFDREELESSMPEFEQLIFMKIRYGLACKFFTCITDKKIV